MREQLTIPQKALQEYLKAAYLQGISNDEAERYIHERRSQELESSNFGPGASLRRQAQEAMELLAGNVFNQGRRQKRQILKDLYELYIAVQSIQDDLETLESGPKLFRDQPDLPEKFKSYIASSHNIGPNGRIQWDSSMNALAFVARHLWSNNGQVFNKDLLKKARYYFVSEDGTEIPEKTFNAALRSENSKNKNPATFGLE